MWKCIIYLAIVAAHATAPIRAILTDIEGTTTSISFVHDILFPYAKEQIRDYLLDHHTEPMIKAAIEETSRLAALPNADLPQVTAILLEWMRQDQKIRPLKTIQGMLWQHGYAEGHFQGHVYADAFDALKEWNNQGLALYVYSSGSVLAQKLLFSHSTYGDITPFFSGYFDTKIGGKKETASYMNIAEKIQLDPSQILFLSDLIDELDAASTAGMQTALLLRENGQAPTPCPHPIAHDFSEISVHR